MKLFISYANDDREIASQVNKKVQEWGFETWIDIDNLPKAEDPYPHIQNGLKTSDVVLGIMTQNALVTREVTQQWQDAIKKTSFILLRWQDIPITYPHLQNALCIL